MTPTEEMVRVALRSYNEDCNGCTAQAPALRRALTAALAAMWQPTHRHKKRGGSYSVIGQAQVQCLDGLTDYEIVTVYRDSEGELWGPPQVRIRRRTVRTDPNPYPTQHEDGFREDGRKRAFRFIC